MSNRLWIGTSGHQYDHWKGKLYPAELPKRQWFVHYAGHFDTVEIDNTYLPEASTFGEWREAAPGGFRYAAQVGRNRKRSGRMQAGAAFRHSQSIT